jgi:plasmid stabilization system protein ParE
VIAVSRLAGAQISGLTAYFEELGRMQAATNLLAALERASRRIVRAPDAGLPAPRPYPALVHLGFRWIKEGPYWVAYMMDPSPIIVGVYHEAADIPNRV